MPFGWLKALQEGASDVMSSINTKVAQFNNKKFSNAVMAINAGVTAADGVIEADERSKNVVAIKTHSALKVFNATELVNTYNKFLDAFEADFTLGEMEIEPVIKALTDPEQQDMAIRLGVMIAKSDGEFDSTEAAFLKKVCGWFGLSPANYDL
jgi:tellurite resistance protein TerB